MGPDWATCRQVFSDEELRQTRNKADDKMYKGERLKEILIRSLARHKEDQEEAEGPRKWCADKKAAELAAKEEMRRELRRRMNQLDKR